MNDINKNNSKGKYYIDTRRIIYREIENELFIFDSRAAELHYLDKTAALFFKALLNNCTFDNALEEIVLNFHPELRERVREDFWPFCEKLVEKQIVDVM